MGACANSVPVSSMTRSEVSGKPKAVTAAEASNWARARMPLLARVRNAPMSSAESGWASCTAASKPALCSARAAAVPAMPPPMTSTRATPAPFVPRRPARWYGHGRNDRTATRVP